VEREKQGLAREKFYITTKNNNIFNLIKIEFLPSRRAVRYYLSFSPPAAAGGAGGGWWI
jgi:hypothetical protein